MRISSIAPIVSLTLLTLDLAHAQTALPSASTHVSPEAPSASDTASTPSAAPATAPVAPPATAPATVVTSATPVPVTPVPVAPVVGASADAVPVTPVPAPPAPAAAAPPDSPKSPTATTGTEVSDSSSNASGPDTGDAAPLPNVQLEDPEPSQGHFIALGFHGIGAMAFDKNRGTREPTFGPGLSLRFGEAVTDWLSLSLAFALGSTSGEPRDSFSTIGRFGITSQWYFTERWFAQAGFGAANVQGPDPEDHDKARGRYGDVYLTGLGYNFYISDSHQSGGWVLTPILTAEVGPDSKFTTASLSLGVELSWWNGLTRDKLNLPNSKAYAK